MNSFSFLSSRHSIQYQPHSHYYTLEAPGDYSSSLCYEDSLKLLLWYALPLSILSSSLPAPLLIQEVQNIWAKGRERERERACHLWACTYELMTTWSWWGLILVTMVSSFLFPSSLLPSSLLPSSFFLLPSPLLHSSNSPLMSCWQNSVCHQKSSHASFW